MAGNAHRCSGPMIIITRCFADRYTCYSRLAGLIHLSEKWHGHHVRIAAEVTVMTAWEF